MTLKTMIYKIKCKPLTALCYLYFSIAFCRVLVVWAICLGSVTGHLTGEQNIALQQASEALINVAGVDSGSLFIALVFLFGGIVGGLIWPFALIF